MPWTGNSGKILKKPEDYSKNPNTVRARKRKAGLSAYQRETEQARASDTKAVTRAWKLSIETDVYKMATAEERNAILETVEGQVMERRRSKGYDAKSKIQNFLYRQGLADSTTPPTTTGTAASSTMNSKVDPNLGHIIHTPAPPGYGMQPVAPMHATPYGHQVGSGYDTSGSFFPCVMPSIEDQANTEAYFPQQPQQQQQHSFNTPSRPILSAPVGPYTFGFGNDEESADAATIDRLQVDLAAEAMTKANLHVKLRENDEKVIELEKHIDVLNRDLVVTKESLRVQEDRMEQIDARMRAYDGTAAGLNGAEAEFFTQATKLRRVVSGVQKIAEVLGEVAEALVDDRGRNKGIEDAISAINAADNQDLDMRETHVNSKIGANGVNNFHESGEGNIRSG